MVFVLCGAPFERRGELLAQAEFEADGASDAPTSQGASQLVAPSGQPALHTDLAERATRTLVAHHFANVAAFAEGSRLFVIYENARYRDERRALREAAEILLPELHGGQELVLVPTNRAIPLMAARYTTEEDAGSRAEHRGDRSAADAPRPKVAIDVSSLPRALLRAHRASSSFGRLDVVVHPWFEAVFGDYANPVASRTGVAPELQMVLRPGLSISTQALFTLQDDVPTGESRVRPGLVTLNQTVRLPANVFVSATAGNFNPNRYGVDLEARAYFANGRLWVGGELALTGAISYARAGWYRTPMRDRTALVEVAGRIARYDLVLRTTAGMFLEDDPGVRLDVVRQLGEFEIGWFILASEEGTNGGLALRIPLLPARHSAPSPVRVRPTDAFRWQYRYRGVGPPGRRFNTGNALEEFGQRLNSGWAGTDQLDDRCDQDEKTSRPPPGRELPPSWEPPTGPIPSQTLTGMTGLVTVPTAAMPSQGAVTLGMNLVDERYHGYSSPRLQGHPAMVQFASVGFLPFAEVGLRLTRVAGVPRQALGDRMLSVRLRVVREGTHIPAVVVGAHDLLGTQYFHAEYIVASKHLEATPLGTVGVHAGYGGDWSSARAQGWQFVGVFGGVSVAPRHWVTFMAEYDAKRVNAGVRLRVWRLNLLGAAYGLGRISGGISYTHQLR